MLTEIEHIDDDADGAGINFVKIDDKQMAKEYGVFALPAVLFFKMGSKDPVIYAGNFLFVLITYKTTILFEIGEDCIYYCQLESVPSWVSQVYYS